MTRRERARIAAERRAIAIAHREAGHTWEQVGLHLGVSASRAKQIAAPCERAKVRMPRWDSPPGTTLAQYIEARARRVDACVAAVEAAVKA